MVKKIIILNIFFLLTLSCTTNKNEEKQDIQIIEESEQNSQYLDLDIGLTNNFKIEPYPEMWKGYGSGFIDITVFRDNKNDYSVLYSAEFNHGLSAWSSRFSKNFSTPSSRLLGSRSNESFLFPERFKNEIHTSEIINHIENYDEHKKQLQSVLSDDDLEDLRYFSYSNYAGTKGICALTKNKGLVYLQCFNSQISDQIIRFSLQSSIIKKESIDYTINFIRKPSDKPIENIEIDFFGEILGVSDLDGDVQINDFVIPQPFTITYETNGKKEYKEIYNTNETISIYEPGYESQIYKFDQTESGDLFQIIYSNITYDEANDKSNNKRIVFNNNEYVGKLITFKNQNEETLFVEKYLDFIDEIGVRPAIWLNISDILKQPAWTDSSFNDSKLLKNIDKGGISGLYPNASNYYFLWYYKRSGSSRSINIKGVDSQNEKISYAIRYNKVEK